MVWRSNNPATQSQTLFLAKRPTLAVRKNRYFYTLSTFYTKLKSHTNRKSDIICSFAPHNVCQSLAKQKKTTPLRLTMSAKVFQNLKNQKKKNKKKKKTKKPTPTPQILSIPWVCFFCFFCFLEVFATFGGKPQENQKKQKKQKKQKNQPQPPRSSPSHGFVFFVFFVFFGFLEVFATFGGKPQKTKALQYSYYHIRNSALRQPLSELIWKSI